MIRMSANMEVLHGCLDWIETMSAMRGFFLLTGAVLSFKKQWNLSLVKFHCQFLSTTDQVWGPKCPKLMNIGKISFLCTLLLAGCSLGYLIPLALPLRTPSREQRSLLQKVKLAYLLIQSALAVIPVGLVLMGRLPKIWVY